MLICKNYVCMFFFGEGPEFSHSRFLKRTMPPKIMNKKQKQSQKKSKPLEINSKDSKSYLLCVFFFFFGRKKPFLTQSLPTAPISSPSDPFSSYTFFCTISYPPFLSLYFLVSLSGLFFLHFLTQQAQALICELPSQ